MQLPQKLQHSSLDSECFQHTEKAKLMLQAIFHRVCGELGHAQTQLLRVAGTVLTRSFLQSWTKLGKKTFSCSSV